MAGCRSSECCRRHPRACRRAGGQAAVSSVAISLQGPSHDDGDSTVASARLRAVASPAGDVVVSHTTGGAHMPFARNWWRHLQRAGVNNFALIATDESAFTTLEDELAGHGVRCPQSIVGRRDERTTADYGRGHGAGYRSAGWTRLMFAVPAMVRWVLLQGVNVLWMDTDVVVLSDPFPAVFAELAASDTTAPRRLATARTPASSAVLLASVDGRVPDEDLHECRRQYTTSVRWGRSSGGFKLCGGLFYIRRGDAADAFLLDWERRLRAPGAGAKNQPHYNDALRAAPQLAVRLLPCALFPNGYRYASDAWRRAQRQRPIAVHNNWLKGSTAKVERFKLWGMWLEGNSSRR